MKPRTDRLSGSRSDKGSGALAAHRSIGARSKRTTGDAVKLTAAFGIVVAHVTTPQPIAAVGYTAIALFIAMYVQRVAQPLFRAGGKGTDGLHLTLRLRHLLIPWLAWCAVYKAVDVYRARDLGLIFTLDDPLSLLAGSATHLWFLPFICLVTVALGIVVPRLRTRRAVIAGWFLAAPVTWLCFYGHDHASLPDPFAQWSFGLPAAMYGVLAAASRKFGLSTQPWAILGFVVTASFVPGPTQWLVFYVAALLVFEWTLVTVVEIPIPLALRRLAFTMYLAHPLALLIWHKFAGHYSTVAADVVAAAAITLALGWVIRRLPIARDFI